MDRSQLKGEDRVVFQMDLAPEDLDRVDILLENSISEWSLSPPKRGRSKIIRLLLEEMVESMPELASIRKKREKEMLITEKAPRIAANALGEKDSRTSFYTPAYVHESAITPNQGSRGSGQLSSFFREAVDEVIASPEIIDQLPPILSFRMPQGFRRKYTPPGGGDYNFSERVSLVLFQRQREPIEMLKRKYGKRHNFLPQQQYASFLGALALWKSGTDQAQLPGYVDWVEFVHKYTKDSSREWVQSILARLEGTVFMRTIKN